MWSNTGGLRASTIFWLIFSLSSEWVWAASRSCQMRLVISSSVALGLVTSVMLVSLVWKTRKGGGATVGRGVAGWTVWVCVAVAGPAGFCVVQPVRASASAAMGV